MGWATFTVQAGKGQEPSGPWKPICTLEPLGKDCRSYATGAELTQG
jgi:hypothetical protein